MTERGPEALGPRNTEVRRLRTLLRDPSARAAEAAFVLEGPRIVADALRRGAVFDAIFLGPNARAAFRELVEVLSAAEVPIFDLKEGVLEKLGSTRTPQPVLAVATIPPRPTIAALTGEGPVLVAVGIADPGNLGTLLRSAEASGCAGVVCCGESVDVYNPKVVRASAGAVFGIPIVAARPGGVANNPVDVLRELREAGRKCFGATAGGAPASEVDLTVPVALVLGNEAHGLSAAVLAEVDGLISVPMSGSAESLNVAMAGTVLAFEAARQRNG
ncbi:MAG: TrmH family RNA methyltransferase [Acidimicrobiia bacterium]